MAFNKKNRKTMSGFLKIRVFFKKSALRKTAAFSVSDTGDPLILTCLVFVFAYAKSRFSHDKAHFIIVQALSFEKLS